jgi:glutaredoxin
MSKSLLIIAAATVIITIVGVVFLNKGNQVKETPPPATSYEYFWSETCPHCAKVAEFLDSWDKKDKLELNKMEVNQNPDSAQLLVQRAVSCGIKQNEIGVPFLFTPDNQCIVGDTPIIEFFKNLEL